MYLHLDTNTVIRTREIVAILDIENSSVSKITREFFAAAQSRGEIIYLSGTELPKSFLLCESDFLCILSNTACKMLRDCVK